MSAITYTIPSLNMTALVARLEGLNKRAVKLNMPPIAYEVGEKTVEDKREYQAITIEGDAPIINGWTMVAAIEYLEVGELVKSIGEFKCPKEYRNCKPFCQHCNTHKVKRYTFLLRNADGELKNVGRTCMQDFLGKDMDGHVARFSFLAAIHDELRDSDSEWNDGSNGATYYSVLEIMSYSARSIRYNGFKPSSMEEESTRSVVEAYLCDPVEVEQQDEVYAKACAQWILDNTNDNDFIINCQNVIKSNYGSFRNVGLLAGAVGAYTKHLAKQFIVKNEYVGDIKKRYTMELKLVRMNDFDTQYGTTWIHTFIDQDNRCFVWFGSKRLYSADIQVSGTDEDGDYNYTEYGQPITIGTSVKVKATVKEHKEYKGTKQTMVTRVALVK